MKNKTIVHCIADAYKNIPMFLMDALDSLLYGLAFEPSIVSLLTSTLISYKCLEKIKLYSQSQYHFIHQLFYCHRAIIGKGSCIFNLALVRYISFILDFGNSVADIE